MNRPMHFEILADDPQSIASFYREVFGWEAATWEGQQAYWLVTTGAPDTPGIDGGIMHKHFEQRVINTIPVASIDAMVAKIERAGGRKVHGPQEIEGVGVHVYCADPEGTLFGILEPADSSG